MSRKGLGKAIRSLASRMRRRSPADSKLLPPEALLELRIAHVEKQLEEVKGRVNALMLIILAAVITDVVMQAVT